MQIEEIISIVQLYGINVNTMEKQELILAIQRAVGNEQCFGTNPRHAVKAAAVGMKTAPHQQQNPMMNSVRNLWMAIQQLPNICRPITHCKRQFN